MTAATELDARELLARRVVDGLTQAMEVFGVYLGVELGLYRVLSELGAATEAELAGHAGVAVRYTREWLEQQAVAGYLACDDPAQPAERRRFRLPAGHAEVLVDPDSLSYLAYLGRFAVALGATAPAVRDAFRAGAGVAWEAFGSDLREGQGEQNRPIFLRLLGREWLPAIPDVDSRLRARPPARVADVACGLGWSSIAVALAYPDVLVDGFDLDAPAIEIARRNAAEAGVADRVRFHVRDAGGPDLAGRYDLVMICEALHDLSRPVEALRAMRSLAGAGGTVLVVDEKVAEAFTAPGDDLERLYFGFSVLCCLPTGLAEQPSAATGTVMRPATLRRYAEAAGFRAVEALPVEHDLFRLYRLLGT
jgi:2-polyprenyl-3-methyl-5-hydroxy-6-metoxy-1,4-benzoquinol methylase